MGISSHQIKRMITPLISTRLIGKQGNCLRVAIDQLGVLETLSYLYSSRIDAPAADKEQGIHKSVTHITRTSSKNLKSKNRNNTKLIKFEVVNVLVLVLVLVMFVKSLRLMGLKACRCVRALLGYTIYYCSPCLSYWSDLIQDFQIPRCGIS